MGLGTNTPNAPQGPSLDQLMMAHGLRTTPQVGTGGETGDPGPGGSPGALGPGGPGQTQSVHGTKYSFGDHQGGGPMDPKPQYIRSTATRDLRQSGYGPIQADQFIRAARHGNLTLGPQGFSFTNDPRAGQFSYVNPHPFVSPGGNLTNAQRASDLQAALAALQQRWESRRGKKT